MPIETSCEGCGQQLRVLDEHAGKLARCPSCNSIYRVPVPDGLEAVVQARAEAAAAERPLPADPLAPIPFDSESLGDFSSIRHSRQGTGRNHAESTDVAPATDHSDDAATDELAEAAQTHADNAAARPVVDEDLLPTTYPNQRSTSTSRDGQSRQDDSAAGPSRWLMRTPEGAEYGPVPHHELRVWVREGRVSADCELREDGGPWFPADEMFPQLRPGPRSVSSYPNATFVNPGSQSVRARHVQRRLPADRGAIILALGIMGWIIVCPFVSLAAWIMGASDLRQMREGRMMRSNIGMTQVGRTLGMLHVILAALFIIFLFFINA